MKNLSLALFIFFSCVAGISCSFLILPFPEAGLTSTTIFSLFCAFIFKDKIFLLFCCVGPIIFACAYLSGKTSFNSRENQANQSTHRMVLEKQPRNECVTLNGDKYCRIDG